MKVCAIVVTYNREKLLEEQIIDILQKQTLRVDAYYIIDNCSTDNTKKMIEKYENGIVKYRKTQSNCGGAGGFSYGLRCAYEDGYDWYILMDDDGKPMNENCLLNMKIHITKNAYNSNGLFFLNSLVLSDDYMLSFGLGHMENLKEISSVIQHNEIIGMANPFNGTWISNGLVKKIGYPNEEFFIKGDENDYLRRTKKADGYVATVVDSRYKHPKLNGYKKMRVFGKEMYVYVEPAWKEYYSVRNYTYSFMQFGEKKEAIFFLLKRVYCCFVCKCKKTEVLKMLVKGYSDGKKGKLGATIRP